MNTYLFTSKTGATKMLFTYNQEGFLVSFKAEPEDMASKSLQWIFRHMPYHEHNIERFRKIEGLTITKVALDMSFDAFYNAYAYKIGNKKRCAKLWEGMNETDKAKCLASLFRYNAHIARTTQAKAYPETYLAQRRWENDFK